MKQYYSPIASPLRTIILISQFIFLFSVITPHYGTAMTNDKQEGDGETILADNFAHLALDGDDILSAASASDTDAADQPLPYSDNADTVPVLSKTACIKCLDAFIRFTYLYWKNPLPHVYHKDEPDVSHDRAIPLRHRILKHRSTLTRTSPHHILEEMIDTISRLLKYECSKRHTPLLRTGEAITLQDYRDFLQLQALYKTTPAFTLAPQRLSCRQQFLIAATALLEEIDELEAYKNQDDPRGDFLVDLRSYLYKTLEYHSFVDTPCPSSSTSEQSEPESDTACADADDEHK